MTTEGLILDKTPFQDRHLICRLLMRSGQKISVMFYGGRGGGKKKLPSVLDLGVMVRLHPVVGRTTGSLYKSRQWSVLWRHEGIRQCYRSFGLLCFYLEVAAKMALEGDWRREDGPRPYGQRLFSATGNALKLLEENSRRKNRSPYFESSLFLAKVLIAEGVFPEVSRCMATGGALPLDAAARLVNELGGFVGGGCPEGGRPSPFAPDVHAKLRRFLALAARIKYADVCEDPSIDRLCFRLLLDYGLYQFHLEEGDFRTLPILA